MNDIASFNLLAHVVRRPKLSASRMFVLLFLCIVIFMTYFVFQKRELVLAEKESADADMTINNALPHLFALAHRGENNAMLGFGSRKNLQDATVFYAEFEALTQLNVKGLWFKEVVIERSPFLIKISGMMQDKKQLKVLLQQLSQQAIFQSLIFTVVEMHEGVLPDVPVEYQSALKSANFPTFYHFVIEGVEASGEQK